MMPTRYIPPRIEALLNDPRVAPKLRSVLRALAGRPTETWTVAELQFVEQVVPSLTEMYISTRTLSDFYEFLGLDPTQLFEPQLGQNWQSTGMQFDSRNPGATQQAECYAAQGLGQQDPSQVTLQTLAACSANGG